MDNKIKLFNRAYSSHKSILIVDSFLEEDAKGFVKEILFFEIKFYKEEEKVQMLLDTHALRGLCYGLEDLLYNGTSTFQKFSGGSSSKKHLSIGKGEKGVIFINLENRADGTKVEYLFGANGTKSFIDAMRLYADEVDKMLYRYQYMRTRST